MAPRPRLHTGGGTLRTEGVPRRLRILHVAAPAAAGGLERVVQSLAIGHQRQGHDVHAGVVLDPGPDDHPFLRPLRDAGVRVHSITLPPRAYVADRRWMRELCLRVRPDVVHTHGYRVDLLDAPVARSLGIPTITTIHGSSVMGGRSRFFEWLQKRAYRRFDAVIAVSPQLFDATTREALRDGALHLVPNAFDDTGDRLSRAEARRELGLPEDALVVGWVARMIRIKGGDVFVEALGRLKDVPFMAAIIGNGPERARCEQIAQACGIADRCRFYGERIPASPYFPAFDVFTISSRSEGTPIALFEAMAAGAAVVSTAVGGVPEVIGDERAWLVPPENPDALAGALREALTNAAERARRIARGRERLRDYSLGPWLAAHERIYRSLSKS